MTLFTRRVGGKRACSDRGQLNRARAHIVLDRVACGHSVSDILVVWALIVTGDLEMVDGDWGFVDMAMIEDIDRRLHNWARWLAGGMSGGLGYGRSSMWNNVQVDCGTAVEAIIPTNAVEASETHEEVEKLPLVLRDTVRLYYTRTQSRAGLAILLNCAVATVDARLTRAHRVLQDAFMDRDEARRQVRQRYEAATKMARSRGGAGG